MEEIKSFLEYKYILYIFWIIIFIYLYLNYKFKKNFV